MKDRWNLEFKDTEVLAVPNAEKMTDYIHEQCAKLHSMLARQEERYILMSMSDEALLRFKESVEQELKRREDERQQAKDPLSSGS